MQIVLIYLTVAYESGETNLFMNYWKKRTRREKRHIATIILLFVILVSLTVTLCVIYAKKSPPLSESLTCQTNACKARGEELKRWINNSVDPCEDFYKYCCGGWLQENQLPNGSELYDASRKLELKIAQDIRKVLDEKTIGSRLPHSVKQMLTFYNACLDTDSIERRGTQNLLKFLNEMGGWPLLSKDWNSSGYDWVDVISRLVRKTATGYIIRFIVSPDARNTSNSIIQLDRPGLLLDAKELLSSNDTTNLDKFKTRIKNIAMFLNASNDDLDQEIEGIVDFERNLARMSTPAPEHQENWYNKATIKEFQKQLPKFQLLTYLQLVTSEALNSTGELLSDGESIIIRDLPYLQSLTEFITDKPNIQRQIANYLGWRIIEKYDSHLPSDLVKLLRPDANSSLGRWKFCVSLTNVAMGYAVAHAYIRPKNALLHKTDVENMVDKLKKIFRNTVLETKWMDNKTKEEAIRKINVMEDNIGYPDWVMKETSLDEFYQEMKEMGTDPFINDFIVAEYTSTKLMMSLRQQPKFPEWNVNPLTVNAGYNHNENSITIPISMFQLPFYDYDLPRYLNYAKIGAVIGHEITHGFDTKGSERDADGNTINWWTDESIKEFDKRASCFIQQYNSYGVNGERTLAENIADNGGLKQAYLGYKREEKYENSNTKLLPGFENYSTDQLFFLSYCTMWCTQYSEYGWNASLSSLQHSPSIYRVWGTASNMNEFSEAFQCPKNKTMNGKNKCSIW